MTELVTTTLPDDIDALKAIIFEHQMYLKKKEESFRKQAESLKKHANKIHFLEEYIRSLKAQMYGKSSERFVPDEQLSLFNESEVQDEETAAENAEACITETSTTETDNTDTSTPKKRAGRRKLPAHLPRHKIIHELPETERKCSCGCQMDIFGEDVSEQLGIIPAELYVIQHCRQKYRCTQCKDQAPITAPMPAQPFPKSNASAELMAHVTVSKFLDGLPFYRQEAMWDRLGIEFSRATMARWSVQAGSDLAQPLINLMQEHQNSASVKYIDETTVAVLKEPDKPPQGKKHFWVTASGPPEKPVYLFHYNPSRGSEVARALLEGFNGTVMSDDWAVYARVCESRKLSHINCNDHARRRFDAVIKALPANKNGKNGKTHAANMALSFYRKLYTIERKIKECSAEEKYRIRQKESVPIWNQFIAWMEKHIEKTAPESLFGKALHYTWRLREKLSHYCNDGNFPMSNQVAENAIRPFAIARKNFLFFDTPKGATASANLYSLIMTAKSHDLNPMHYLTCVFKLLPRATTVKEIEALLPWNVTQELMESWLKMQ